MKTFLGSILTALCCLPLAAQVLDDFSAGDWRQFASTPGTSRRRRASYT